MSGLKKEKQYFARQTMSFEKRLENLRNQKDNIIKLLPANQKDGKKPVSPDCLNCRYYDFQCNGNAYGCEYYTDSESIK